MNGFKPILGDSQVKHHFHQKQSWHHGCRDCCEDLNMAESEATLHTQLQHNKRKIPFHHGLKNREKDPNSFCWIQKLRGEDQTSNL